MLVAGEELLKLFSRQFVGCIVGRQGATQCSKIQGLEVCGYTDCIVARKFLQEVLLRTQCFNLAKSIIVRRFFGRKIRMFNLLEL